MRSYNRFLVMPVVVLMCISFIINPVMVSAESNIPPIHLGSSEELILVTPEEITVDTLWGGTCTILMINLEPVSVNVRLVVSQDRSPHSVLPTHAIPIMTIDALSNISFTLSLRVELDPYEGLYTGLISYTETGIFLEAYDADNASVRLCVRSIEVNIVVIMDLFNSEYGIVLGLLAVGVIMCIVIVHAKTSRRFIAAE